VSLLPSPGFNPRPRCLSTPTDAFQLHPDFRLYGTTLRLVSAGYLETALELVDARATRGVGGLENVENARWTRVRLLCQLALVLDGGVEYVPPRGRDGEAADADVDSGAFTFANVFHSSSLGFNT